MIIAPLQLAQLGLRVTALDLVSGTTRLLRDISARLDVSLDAAAGGATALPLASRCADTVYAVHLLEHLSGDAGATALTEMLRVARRRVVVAVPFEDEPKRPGGTSAHSTDPRSAPCAPRPGTRTPWTNTTAAG